MEAYNSLVLRSYGRTVHGPWRVRRQATDDYALNLGKPPAAAASGEDEIDDVNEEQEAGPQGIEATLKNSTRTGLTPTQRNILYILFCTQDGKGQGKRGAADSSGAGPRKKSKFSIVEEIASVPKSVDGLVSLEEERMRMKQAEVETSSSSSS
ncbi:hypothetical protein CF327_g6836 [Tilletia walkeri]|uniref:Uncharacterized protein n=1 Tax=Tilletia walkeri TaxID=117179 RepID=A0A8X7N9M6_9BASI|nr:hypothetical protein CF327_g6836 [Tilletia walkeri]KAE8269821.1 hypothetical protein A4X09_0g2503 [Tilletia walkeri]